MTWQKTLPDAPGRYWWRAKNAHGRLSYGILLIKWQHFVAKFAPELRVTSTCSFAVGYDGEVSDGHGWYFGGSDPRLSHGDFEIWSIPERGPEGFLPDLPGNPAPDWAPPDPAVVAAEKAGAKQKADTKKVEEENERVARFREAKESGYVLYECSSCGELHDQDNLVTVRECPHCDENFNGTDEGRHCPTCNRPFSRRVTEHGCPDCLEECEVADEEDS